MTRSLTIPWPNHLITLEEWEALPDDGVRLELVEGVIAVSPQPFPWHQFACHNLARLANDRLPRSLITLGEIEVVVAEPPLTIRIPDLVVTRTARYEANPPRLAATDVLLAVEVLSDGTRRVDRVLKFAEYAEARIPQYWILDLDEPTSLLTYVLVDDSYELSGEHTGTTMLDVAGHPVEIDLPALIRR
ncbi:Uma2 family endonuclease [Pseudonocardia kunmingensis]|uniref:Uma2 family endonuclease n=1 Tax=Pseudonocardia kunmingensis TaxID=630975 RepID=A0A543D440_9PSEU|nr:Uma2 family endonuclease [Pseudonocardia kunmingensis]TQM04106.1 Uma2 family endonuclease [Pseudonocardia kunmingensis]